MASAAAWAVAPQMPATFRTRRLAAASWVRTAATGESENRPQEARLPDRELRGVDADRHPARPGLAVVAGQRDLPPLVELALGT